jgi:predicted nucleic acid-binding protein
MSRHWVVDVSPIILLAKTGHLDLLPATADKLLIPKAVAEEIRQAPSDDPARTWLDAEGEQFVEPTGPVAETVAAWDLGRGESRVLSVGVRRDGWTALVDDGAARRCGRGWTFRSSGRSAFSWWPNGRAISRRFVLLPKPFDGPDCTWTTTWSIKFSAWWERRKS